jgi:hypothetical protein
MDQDSSKPSEISRKLADTGLNCPEPKQFSVSLLFLWRGLGWQTGEALWSNPANWLGPDRQAPVLGDEVEFDKPPHVVESLAKGTDS